MDRKILPAAIGLTALVLNNAYAQNPAMQPSQPYSVQQSPVSSDNMVGKFIEFAKGLEGKLPDKLRTDDFGLYSYFQGEQLGILFNGKKFSYTVRVLPDNEFYFSHENYEIPMTQAQREFLLGRKIDYYAKSDSGRVYDATQLPIFKPDENTSIHFARIPRTVAQLIEIQRSFDEELGKFMNVIRESIEQNTNR